MNWLVNSRVVALTAAAVIAYVLARHSDWAVFRSTFTSSYGLSYRDTDRHPYAATAHSNRRHSHTSQTADSYTLTHTHKNATHNPYANSNLHAD